MKYFLAIASLIASIIAVPQAALVQTPRTAVSQDLLDTILHYAGYAATVPFPCQIAPPGAVIQSYAQNEATNTQVTLFRNDGDKEFVLAFPGTSSVQDGVTDLSFVPVPYTGTGIDCKSCTVALGLLEAWNSIQNDSQGLLNAALAQYSGYDITVIGHSLGGGLVGLAYPGLKGAGFTIKQAVSFGQFRTGNPAYASYIDTLSGASDGNIGTYMRVTHANDGVPHFPPRSEIYQHARTEIWADSGRNGTPPATTKNTYRCYGDEPADCNNSQLGVGINTAHINYPGLNVTGCGSIGL